MESITAKTVLLRDEETVDIAIQSICLVELSRLQEHLDRLVGVVQDPPAVMTLVEHLAMTRVIIGLEKRLVRLIACLRETVDWEVVDDAMDTYA